MQLLTFTIAGESYAIESRRVVEVLPLVPARPIPLTPGYVRGVFTYRGSLVPLVDLGRRLGDVVLEERLSTRVIVAEYLPPGSRPPARLGLVAENVISIVAAERAETSLPALELAAAPFLGRILRIDGRTVQVVDVDRLLPADLAAGLFPAASTEAAS
ncbi:MAG: chemotaxis protein CheW [Planctomycetaceae bacterium]|nr:chemotaxis protein CheW [Planctomycetaceae bacterium]